MGDIDEGAAELADKHTFPCESCGATLTFAPGTARLTCQHCGREQAVEAEVGAHHIQEHDFAEGLRRARRAPAREWARGGEEVRCDGCGARTVLTEQSGSCPYCDSPLVVATNRDDGDIDPPIVPESVLPFRLERAQARAKFGAWLGSLWFAPGDLKERARADKLDGVYLPYWTYDSNTTTRYRGQRGEHYWVTEHYTDAQGKRQTRRVRKTRWWPASGTVYVGFDDVLVCASESLPRALIRKLEPWDLTDLRPYSPGYLSGFVTERYAVDLEAGFTIAEARMEPEIRAAVRRDIGGDEQRISHIDVRHADVRWKHCLLPLWISSFRYRDKVYRFTVNARTGEIAGERPWSWIKITLAVLLALALIAGGYFGFQAARG